MLKYGRNLCDMKEVAFESILDSDSLASHNIRMCYHITRHGIREIDVVSSDNIPACLSSCYRLLFFSHCISDYFRCDCTVGKPESNIKLIFDWHVQGRRINVRLILILLFDRNHRDFVVLLLGTNIVLENIEPRSIIIYVTRRSGIGSHVIEPGCIVSLVLKQ